MMHIKKPTWSDPDALSDPVLYTGHIHFQQVSVTMETGEDTWHVIAIHYELQKLPE